MPFRVVMHSMEQRKDYKKYIDLPRGEELLLVWADFFVILELKIVSY